MNYELLDDPGVFRERAARLLVDEARHNLMLGVLGTLIRTPEVYDTYRLFLVSDQAGPQSAAVITPPFNLMLSDAPNEAALRVLVEGVLADGIEIPGVIGNQPTIDRFAGDWKRATNTHPLLKMEQGVFALEEVNDVKHGPGEARSGLPSDQQLLEVWMRRFLTEAMPDEPYDEERMAKVIKGKLSGGSTGGYWLWEDAGEVVSWSGHGNPTGRGIRVGPVYTPPELRGRGYASGLVAAQSRWLIDNGYEYCFLYTDLANPTSNAIYERIGYRQIAESAVYGLAAAAGSD